MGSLGPVGPGETSKLEAKVVEPHANTDDERGHAKQMEPKIGWPMDQLLVLGLALGVESPFIWWWSMKAEVVSLVNGRRLERRFVSLVNVPSQTNGSRSGLKEEPQTRIMVGIFGGSPTDLTVKARQECNQ